jgi:type IV pilus assembly protein PilO
METGLEGKPWYYGLAVGLGVGIAVFLLYHFKLSDGKRDEIAKADSKIQTLQQKIQEGRAAQRREKEFEEEVKRLKAELDQLLKILPARRETPDLIRKVRILTEQAGFNLRVFDPTERLSDREFYRVWPIKIDLLGGYHELAQFFEQVSRLSRIINIRDLRITANRSQARHSLTARFTAETFVYKEPAPDEEDEPAKPASKKKRGGAR